jgi:hypothetical protein
VSRSIAEECRRRARECLHIARTSEGSDRILLLDMAQTWLRLAEEEEEEASIPPDAVGQSQPVVQQQQQAQPKKDPTKE